MDGASKPTCWKCGYELTGLRVEERCPECGTPVWSAPPPIDTPKVANHAFQWGLASLALFFICLGPLAILVAVPAITEGSRARAAVRDGRLPASAAAGATVGLVCAWATVALSLGTAVVIFLVSRFG